MKLDEAIRHAEEVAEEQDKRVPYKIYDDDEWTEEQENCHKCAEEHRQLAEWLKDYKRMLEQTEWIPVSEMLPEDDGEYLATIYDTDENYKYMDIAEREDGIWQYKDYIKVLAWMPLPHPYESQERSE